MTLVDGDPDNYLADSVYEIDPWASLYRPWFEHVDGLFSGWDYLPEPRNFEKLGAACREGIRSTTEDAGNSQDGGSVTSDGQLANLFSSIRDNLAPGVNGIERSGAVAAFNFAYGAARLKTVIGNHRQVVIGAGLCIAGAQSVWYAAGNDVMQLAKNAEIAFDNPTPDPLKLDPAITSALTDVVEEFLGPATKPYQALRTVLTSVVKVDKALAARNAPVTVDASLSGSSATEIALNLRSAISSLASAVNAQEQALAVPVNSLLADMGGDKAAYHIHPRPHVDRTFANQPSIDLDLPGVRTVINKSLPGIASVMLDLARYSQVADAKHPWRRNVAIGYGETGVWPELSTLLGYSTDLLQSSAKELMVARAMLAQFINEIEGVDQAEERIYSRYKKDLAGVGMRAGPPPEVQRPMPPWWDDYADGLLGKQS